MSEVAPKKNSPNSGTQPSTVPDGTHQRTVRYRSGRPTFGAEWRLPWSTSGHGAGLQLADQTPS